MEGWRKFIKESQQLSRDDLKLYYVDKSDGDGKAFNIILYIFMVQKNKLNKNESEIFNDNSRRLQHSHAQW